VATVLQADGLVGGLLESTNPWGGAASGNSEGGVNEDISEVSPEGDVGGWVAGGEVLSGREALGVRLVAEGAASSAATSSTPPGVGLRPSRNALAMSAAFHFA
jgi:hypothetical protein